MGIGALSVRVVVRSAALAVLCLLSLHCPVSAEEPLSKSETAAAVAGPSDGAVTEGEAEEEEVLAIEFVTVPGGEFVMGSEEGEKDERPPHQVRISSFELGRFEITQRQWELVMGDNPSATRGCGDCPVEMVFWEDVQEFLREAGRVTGMKLRLPTEAEWEYAAGGGEAHRKWAGTDDAGDLGEYAWFGRREGKRTHPAGGKKPNRFGLHDMAGNVWEWCADAYEDGYYSRSPSEDPQGPGSEDCRVLRGGSWFSDARDVRVANRMKTCQATRHFDLGFRVARDAP